MKGQQPSVEKLDLDDENWLCATLEIDLPTLGQVQTNSKAIISTALGSCLRSSLPLPFKIMKETYIQNYFREKSRLKIRGKGQGKNFSRPALLHTLELMKTDAKLIQGIQENLSNQAVINLDNISSDDTGISIKSKLNTGNSTNNEQIYNTKIIKHTIMDLLKNPDDEMKCCIRSAVELAFNNGIITTDTLNNRTDDSKSILREAVKLAFEGDLMLLSVKRDRAAKNLKLKRTKDNSGEAGSSKTPLEMCFEKMEHCCKCNDCRSHFNEANKDFKEGDRSKCCCCNTCLEHMKNVRDSMAKKSEYNANYHRGRGWRNSRNSYRWHRGY
jgi:hypothetical protein